MEITKKLVEDLSILSRLNFSENELQAFKAEFEKTMEHIDELQKINTTGAKSFARTLDAKALRADEIKPSLPQEVALREAPKKQHGLFAVSKIVE